MRTLEAEIAATFNDLVSNPVSLDELPLVLSVTDLFQMVRPFESSIESK